MFDQLVIRDHVVTLAPHELAEEAIRQVSYDWVVNCAGYIGKPNVDACEKDKAATFLGNAIFPIKLQELCLDRDIRFAHFSSGCIYEGNITNVMADPNYFGSTYSVSKGVSDTILKHDPNSLVLRVRLPFDGSNSPKNLLTKLYNYSKTAKLIEGGPNSITDIDEAVSVTADLIQRDWNGPVNLVQWNPITSAEIVKMMGITASWYTAEEFKSVTAAGRSNCVIPAYEHMTPVEISLEKAIASFKKTL